jgi:pyruvate dehydrogenase E2 component (dihydrolipoyllysine-residue acetyltransferase)
VSVTSAIQVAMPRLSDSMQEGTIVRWLKGSGESVSAGEAIVEIETDKATMEYEAEAEGVLQILVEEGATVQLGEPIAEILPPGSAPGPRQSVPASPERLLATPIARRLAADLGVDLARVRGTGRRGYVVKADVEAVASANGTPEPAHVEAATASPSERQELSRVQRTIATRMAESRALVPDFTLEVEIEMDACLALRAQLAEHADPVPSINDMVIKACALALVGHPRVNGSYRDDGFDLYEHVNVGFAVAAEDSLLVPVIRDADGRSLGSIARAARQLATRARSGEMTPPELSGGTFTVSNLGMFGISRFIAIINQPQAAILAVGAVAPKPVVRDGQIAIAQVMTATLASDHRILYGADAAAFLTDVRDRLQSPMSLLL